MDTARLSLDRQPFDDPDFLFELKHDGFRVFAHIWDSKCELVSRKRLQKFSRTFDVLALKAEGPVIDGEFVCAL
jgi:bifunctional non-homologous end joining protein LigD